MATRAQFLTTTYGGYHHRDLPDENTELTHVGPGTPCGEYLRRFWQPVLFSHELGDLPIRIRIMSEDLVLFRDRRGEIGLLELHCSHRGTSLEFGIVGDQGIRCCYHGWLFDVDGRILETPGEPADSTLKDRLCHGAYPLREYKGLVFAYMGPPDKKPGFPIWDTISDALDTPEYRLEPGARRIMPCNWLQVKENSMDPAHLQYLHTIVPGVGFTSDFGSNSELDFIESPIGMMYISTRRVGEKAWIRISDFMPPNVHQFPPQEDVEDKMPISRPRTTIWAVPVDDTHTQVITVQHRRQQEAPLEFTSFGQDDRRPYEERQRGPGDYECQTSQRPIAIHALEHLAQTDRGITMFRNIVRRGIRAVQNGEEPPQGLAPPAGGVIPTYSTDTVLDLPSAATSEEDAQLLRETGRKVAEGYIKDPPMLVAH